MLNHTHFLPPAASNYRGFSLLELAIVLLLGLANMMRGGSPDTSQRLMRLRVLLQVVALVIVMVTIWAMGR